MGIVHRNINPGNVLLSVGDDREGFESALAPNTEPSVTTFTGYTGNKITRILDAQMLTVALA